VKISVIICTHNPREDYLRRTLESLERQSLLKADWELLLIDNASDDLLSDAWDLSWHPNGKHVLEKKLGLTPARIRGVKESSGELLLYVDDDNVLAPDYLERSLEIAARMPFLGCFGAGRLEPEFEEEPAPEFQPYTKRLALRTVDAPIWSNDPRDSNPWGAGLVVKKSIAQAYSETVESSETRFLLDRKGEGLNAGGDDEFSWISYDRGLGKGIFPELKIIHLIDRNRLSREYLLKLVKGHAYSGVILHSIHDQHLPACSAIPSGWNVLKHLFALKRSRFFNEGCRWWQWIKKSPTEQDFEKARMSGIKEALVFLGKHTES